MCYSAGLKNMEVPGIDTGTSSFLQNKISTPSPGDRRTEKMLRKER